MTESALKPVCPESSVLAVRVWNMCGLDWAGLPVVCEILGVEDVESLVEQLIEIRDFNRRDNG